MDEVLTHFGDFFLDIFDNHLSKNHVVKVNKLAYFYIYHQDHHFGFNPQSERREILVPAVNRLGYFNLPFNPDKEEVTEIEILDNIKRNDITLIEKDFNEIDELLSIIKPGKDEVEKGTKVEIHTSSDIKLMTLFIAYDDEKKYRKNPSIMISRFLKIKLRDLQDVKFTWGLNLYVDRSN